MEMRTSTCTTSNWQIDDDGWWLFLKKRSMDMKWEHFLKTTREGNQSSKTKTKHRRDQRQPTTTIIIILFIILHHIFFYYIIYLFFVVVFRFCDLFVKKSVQEKTN